MSSIIDGILQGIVTAQSLVGEADRQARAEMRAAEFTHCPACQSGLVLFLNDTPHADHEAIQAVTETLWEQCPTCIAEYTEYSENIPCEHGIRNWENCDQCLEAWAEANAPEDVVLDKPSRWEVENGI